MFKTKGVVEIPNCGLYAKSPEALASFFKELEDRGYKIKDCREERNRPSLEEQMKKGWYLWFARLRDDVCERKGKCGSCGSYIDVRGIQTHKHKCEVCGAYTYHEFVNGSIIRFFFTEHVRCKIHMGAPDIKMKVYDYDDELGCLLFYDKPIEHDIIKKQCQKALDINHKQFRRISARLSKGMRKYIRHLKAQGKYQEVEAVKSRKENRRFGKGLIAIPYDLDTFSDEIITVRQIYGHRWNHEVVKLFQGKEYDDMLDHLPIPQSFTIYESWHWAPLEPSRILHEKIIRAAGMVSDCGYYYQDGREDFYDIHLLRMRLYVEHFTTIPIDRWDHMIKRAPKSGPGMIKTLATFCQSLMKEEIKEVEYTNKPNIVNLLNGFATVMSGKSLTTGEKDAMEDALADREIRDDIKEIIRRRQ